MMHSKSDVGSRAGHTNCLPEPRRPVRIAWLLLSACFLAPGLALAQSSGGSIKPATGALSNTPDDPSTAFLENSRRDTQREALFRTSLIDDTRDAVQSLESSLYDATNIRVSFAWNQVLQGVVGATELPNDVGTTTDFDAYVSWELLNPGEPTQGKFLAHFEGRWDYGTTGPASLGGAAGSAIGTANGFDRYNPTFLPLRNLYWEHGSSEAGWVYRLGYQTPDGIYSVSQHLTPVTTFLSNAGTGAFSTGVPDSGFGASAAYYFTDDIKIVGGLHDANANRTNWGDVDQGDFFKAVQLGARLFPKTETSGFSTLEFWQTPGSSTGAPSNASSGRPGWGFFALHEQEFTDDGDLVGVFRYGQSFNGSALYEQQAGAALLLYDTPDPIGIKHDVVGIQYNWANPSEEFPGFADARSEHAVELFYRFPLVPVVDVSLHYQAIINPALDRSNGLAHALSLRLRTTF